MESEMANRDTFKVRTNLEYVGQSYGPGALADIDAVTAAKLLEMRAIEAPAPASSSGSETEAADDDTLTLNEETAGDSSK